MSTSQAAGRQAFPHFVPLLYRSELTSYGGLGLMDVKIVTYDGMKVTD